MRISYILRADCTGCLFDVSWLPPELLCEYTTLFAFTLCQDDDDTVTNLLVKIVLGRTKVRLSNISPSCHIALREQHWMIKDKNKRKSITDILTCEFITISGKQHNCESNKQ